MGSDLWEARRFARPVGRDCDPLDWLADVLGGTLGFAFFFLIVACRRMGRSKDPKETLEKLLECECDKP